MALLLLALTALVALMTRAVPLTSSLGHDEAMMALRYIAPGPAAMFTDYTPNDHLLFGLVTWLTVQVLPSTEPIYRLWSVLPALTAIALSTWWMWRRHGCVPGLVVAVVLTASPLVMERTGQARGYGLALLGLVVVILAAVAWENGDHRRAPWWFAGGATVAFCSFPLVAMALVGHVLLLARAAERRRQLVRVLLPAAAVSGLLYAPIAVDLWRNAVALVVDPDLPTSFYRITGPEQAGSEPAVPLPVRVLGEMSPAVPASLPLVVMIAVLAVGAAVAIPALAYWWPRDPVILLHSVVPALLLVAGVAVALPYAPRFLTPVVFHLLVPVALTAAWIGLRLRHRALRLVVTALAVVVAVATLWAAVQSSVDRVTSPQEDYRAVADSLDGTGVERVYTTSIHTLPGLLYYLGPDSLTVISNGGRQGLPTEPGRALARRVVSPAEFERELCELDGPVAIIEESLTSDLVDLPCVDISAVRSLEPLGSEGEVLRVFVFPPRADE